MLRRLMHQRAERLFGEVIVAAFGLLSLAVHDITPMLIAAFIVTLALVGVAVFEHADRAADELRSDNELLAAVARRFLNGADEDGDPHYTGLKPPGWDDDDDRASLTLDSTVRLTADEYAAVSRNHRSYDERMKHLL